MVPFHQTFHLSIPCNAFIAYYNYMLRYLLGIKFPCKRGILPWIKQLLTIYQGVNITYFTTINGLHPQENRWTNYLVKKFKSWRPLCNILPAKRMSSKERSFSSPLVLTYFIFEDFIFQKLSLKNKNSFPKKKLSHKYWLNLVSNNLSVFRRKKFKKLWTKTNLVQDYLSLPGLVSRQV